MDRTMARDGIVRLPSSVAPVGKPVVDAAWQVRWQLGKCLFTLALGVGQARLKRGRGRRFLPTASPAKQCVGSGAGA
jgi:hypothetical protein